MTDCDVGEMFLNFMVEPSVRSYAGIDLYQASPEEPLRKGGKLRGYWSIILIGFASSPYFVTKDMLSIDKAVRRYKIIVDNVFGWMKVILNLSGLDLYDPSLPWVFKLRENGSIATDKCWYIDDGYPITNIAWEASKICKKNRMYFMLFRFA